MIFMVVVRILMIVAMPTIRNGQNMKEYSWKYWAPFYIIYLIVFLVAGKDVSDLSYSMLIVDAAMFVF